MNVFSTSVVNVTFEQMVYFIRESNPGFVNVCVILIGAAEREVQVTVDAMEITARSKCMIHVYIPLQLCT